jgi:hypothetical protein
VINDIFRSDFNFSYFWNVLYFSSKLVGGGDVDGFDKHKSPGQSFIDISALILRQDEIIADFA